MRTPRGAKYATATPVDRRRARRRRQRWARTFRPATIDLAIVGEAPPESLDRYFYFPDVWTQDALYRHVVGAVLRMEPSRETKREMLERLRNAGVFLMDVSLEPLNKGPLEPHIPGVIQRLRRANPRRIVLAKANVYDKLFTPLVEAGMPVIDERLRFPAQGWQAEFIESFRRALRRKPATPGARSREASMSRR